MLFIKALVINSVHRKMVIWKCSLCDTAVHTQKQHVTNLKAHHRLHYFFQVFSFRCRFSGVDDNSETKTSVPE